MKKLVMVDASGKAAKSGSYPVLALADADGHQFIHVRRDDGRFNVRFPDGTDEIMTREEILAAIEGRDDESPRAVRAWLALQ